MAVTRTQAWEGAHGAEPTGITINLGSGTSRFLVMVLVRERGTNFTPSTWTYGGQAYSYGGESYLDSTPDLIIKYAIWDEYQINEADDHEMLYADDISTGGKLGYYYATYANCRQVEPTIDTDSTASGTYVDLNTSTADARSAIIGVAIDVSANREPFNVDGLTERIDYGGNPGDEQMSYTVADGLGVVDGTTRIANDGIASQMVGLGIVLEGFELNADRTAPKGVGRGINRGIT
ncbi:MAG: hypothetical protein GOVbin7744_19 [Prokaryotic dsDNA virus sp.]|nr:MAG: hypothetical protein GOVbin7744_19 [Prokaryotic dsDNA virus sp.]|tara:strand:+ start:5388 stop:6092 length:705 start_codon:yes stop_codon:yes gene_type:complete